VPFLHEWAENKKTTCGVAACVFFGFGFWTFLIFVLLRFSCATEPRANYQVLNTGLQLIAKCYLLVSCGTCTLAGDEKEGLVL
jgi:heme/copper-type cytochrome/quinol oxidase subunit 3